jgi:hypothetical protein
MFHNPYVFAGHMWPPNVRVYHIDIKNGRFAFGPESARISPSGAFLTAAARIFGYYEAKFDIVSLLGGRADYQWIYNGINHHHELPARSVLPAHPNVPTHGRLADMTPTIIPSLIDARLHELQDGWSSVHMDVAVFYMGCGQRSQNGPPPADMGNILTTFDMPHDYRLYADSSFRQLRQFMLARESDQVQLDRLSHVLYVTVTSGYYAAVSSEGIPANYRLEAFAYDVMTTLMRGAAYLHLGYSLPSVSFVGCAGQFQYQLTPDAQVDRDATFQMAASPYGAHTHYGYPCMGEIRTFRPVTSEQNPHAISQQRRMAYVFDVTRDLRRHVSINFSYQLSRSHRIEYSTFLSLLFLFFRTTSTRNVSSVPWNVKPVLLPPPSPPRFLDVEGADT